MILQRRFMTHHAADLKRCFLCDFACTCTASSRHGSRMWGAFKPGPQYVWRTSPGQQGLVLLQRIPAGNIMNQQQLLRTGRCAVVAAWKLSVAANTIMTRVNVMIDSMPNTCIVRQCGPYQDRIPVALLAKLQCGQGSLHPGLTQK